MDNFNSGLFYPLKFELYSSDPKWLAGKNVLPLITILYTGRSSSNRALHQVIRMGLSTRRQRRQHSEVQMLSPPVPRHRLEVHHTQTSSVLHLQRHHSMYHSYVSCIVLLLFAA